MAVVLAQRHLKLNESLARESNISAKNFNHKSYAKIENIDAILLNRNISVEKKKQILVKKLHEAVLKTFSIDKRMFNEQDFDSLRKKLHAIRRVILQLRSINHYLETALLENLKLSKTKMSKENSKLKHQDALARDELEALEYTTYKLIGEAVILDKRLLKGYSIKEKKIITKEKIEEKGIGSILRKESSTLEHLEAKLPPPRAVSPDLIKEPVFTHWIARVFSLLAYLEHLYEKEMTELNKLKKNKAVKIKITKKIIQLVKEKSKLLKIMEEKDVSMKTSKNQGFLVPRKSRGFSREFKLGNELKKELHNLTTIINI